MKSIYLLCFVLLICLSTCLARDLIVGTTNNKRLVWQQKVELLGLPLIKHVKEVFYSDPAMQIIRVLTALSFLATGSYQGIMGVSQNLTQRTSIVDRRQRTRSWCVRQVVDPLNYSTLMCKWIQFPLTGIVARDVEQSEASAVITDGGLGSFFVKLRLESARGSGLNYQIEIYTG